MIAIKNSFVCLAALVFSSLCSVDAKSFLRGDSEYNEGRRSLAELSEGSTVICSEDTTKVYRWEGNALHHYPNYLVAKSWDENWKNDYELVDCETLGLSIGEPMKQNVILPPNGGAVMCLGDELQVFHWDPEDSLLRHYPNPSVATIWVEQWRHMLLVDCDGLGLKFGWDLTDGPPTNGSMVICTHELTKVYWVAGGYLRWLPTPEVAASYVEKWRPPIRQIDCEHLNFGDPMPKYA